MKQSQWTFKVHNCLCFSQRLWRFNKLLQLPNGFNLVSDTQRKHSLVYKINKTTYYKKQTNHWNCWVTWNNFVMICYESGLFWMVCYKWVYFQWEPFWSIIMFLWDTTFKLFGGGSNYWCCNNFDLKNKNVNYRKWFWSFQDEWKA